MHAFLVQQKLKNKEYKCVQMKVSLLDSNWYTYSVSPWSGIVSHSTQQPICICKKKPKKQKDSVHQNKINISVAISNVTLYDKIKTD